MSDGSIGQACSTRDWQKPKPLLGKLMSEH
ncbi:uncharacterized protein CPUR_02271 [Claviceps purpurea 20.1]|uniref:Uncharacterized protein n=1 Tax=Claviceps purpurea (strain 20.1) TaxID=1111077 RepID=M1WC27_CLAP2|nr:uncharacterized protein CPUR_02271 [Claviceps purpurea 20.1]